MVYSATPSVLKRACATIQAHILQMIDEELQMITHYCEVAGSRPFICLPLQVIVVVVVAVVDVNVAFLCLCVWLLLALLMLLLFLLMELLAFGPN